MQLRSNAFAEGGQIPEKYTCDGSEISPPLEWSGAPEETQAYALLVTDPDARDFVHWAVADIPKVLTSLGEGASGTDIGGIEGTSSAGNVGWSGPCPPSGEHRYVFDIYALNAPLGLRDVPDGAAIRRALDGHVLAQAQLTARYARR